MAIILCKTKLCGYTQISTEFGAGGELNRSSTQDVPTIPGQLQASGKTISETANDI